MFNHRDKRLENPFRSKNWESNIDGVFVEPCDQAEDPLGYRAVFTINELARPTKSDKTFVVGASYLAKREHNLTRAGYQAPMTHQAITLVEEKLGIRLPVVLA